MINEIYKFWNDYNEIDKSVIMLATTGKPLIAVEAHFDVRYYRGVLHKVKVNIVFCDGRDNVCTLVNLLEPEYPNSVIGICDSDFLQFGIGKHKGNNIYHTDFHDLEMDALKYSDFTTFMSMSVNRKKITDPMLLISKAFDLCRPVGYLRFINEKEKELANSVEEKKSISINFNSFDFVNKKNRKIHSNDFQPDIKMIIKRILDYSENNSHLLQLESIFETVSKEMENNYSDYLICCGHDFIKALYEILKVYGIEGSKLDENRLGDQLAANYHKEYFLKSNLGKQMEALGFI